MGQMRGQIPQWDAVLSGENVRANLIGRRVHQLSQAGDVLELDNFKSANYRCIVPR